LEAAQGNSAISGINVITRKKVKFYQRRVIHLMNHTDRLCRRCVDSASKLDNEFWNVPNGQKVLCSKSL
jgi:hypothetical protein